MTNKKPYPEEFKIETVKQITQRGHRVAEVSTRIGVSRHSLYKWIKVYAMPAPERHQQMTQTEEVRRLKAELKRMTEERDILKKAAVHSTGQVNR
jgi:transposase